MTHTGEADNFGAFRRNEPLRVYLWASSRPLWVASRTRMGFSNPQRVGFSASESATRTHDLFSVGRIIGESSIIFLFLSTAS